jgi:hypothetical protein
MFLISSGAPLQQVLAALAARTRSSPTAANCTLPPGTQVACFRQQVCLLERLITHHYDC